ncbi:MAG TPA: hypothetical protein VGL62_00660 [Vicinamibacterales bacterium]
MPSSSDRVGNQRRNRRIEHLDERVPIPAARTDAMVQGVQARSRLGS